MFLIYGECCAPGAVIFGAAGAVATLGGGWLLSERHINHAALGWLVAGLLLLIPAVRALSYKIWTGLSLFCLCVGAMRLLDGKEALSPLLCVPITALWGLVTVALGRLAMRGRALKRNGRALELGPLNRQHLT